MNGQPTGSGEPARSADVIELRPAWRRFAVAGLVAAASLAGISALVISLALSGGSSTSTSADGARAISAESAGSLESMAAAAVQPPAALSAAASAAAPAATGQADAAAGATLEDSAAAGSASGASGDGQDTTASADCWPALSDQAQTALTGALPPGAFGSPQLLIADCEPASVGGAVVPGTAPGTVLVVRVTRSVPGACVSDTTIGTACVARGDNVSRGDNVYVAGDESGSPVVFAYANGDQVVVSGWPAAGDSVALPSGLTVEQSVAAAEAVLGALA